MKNTHYPKPGHTGGWLIREMISFLRVNGLKLPLHSHIHVATSAGSDSIALAHILVKYGRKIISPSNIHILHINHGWRGKESDLDEQLVRKYAKTWQIPCKCFNLSYRGRRKPPTSDISTSLEDDARNARKRVFEARVATKKGALVFTAHTADDLAETMLWRLFSGSSKTHGGGILWREGHEIRPFLRVRKKTLQTYLREEGVLWREDSTNSDCRFLRARIRHKLLPQIEEAFPCAVSHLVKLGLNAQTRAHAKTALPAGLHLADGDPQILAPSALFAIAQTRIKRAHWDWLIKQGAKSNWTGEVHLPGGWKLIRQKQPNKADRWILEKRN